MGPAVINLDRPTLFVQLARHLVGDGVELGPGHSPFPLPFPGATVRYIDRWEPDANRALFPELGDVEFPMPDIVADLDADRLRALDSESQDFVVASHVLEHMANPLAILAEIHRVLRPGGVTLVLLPDRTRTFDRRRDATPLMHVVEEFDADVTTVSDEHVEDFMRGVGEWDDGWSVDERGRHIDLQRQRSIHVHCWTQDEFPEALVYSIANQGMQWELVEAVFVEDIADSIEFGYVLRRALHASEASLQAARFSAVLDVMRVESQRAASERLALVGVRADGVFTHAGPRNGTRWYSRATSPFVQITRQGGARIRNRIRRRSS